MAIPLVLMPAYTLPKFLNAQELAQQPGRAVDIRYGEAARLVRIDVPRNQWPQPGDVTSVKVCWATLSNDPRDLLVLIQFVDAENRVVATRRTVPGLGAYATMNWQSGLQFCDDVSIAIGAAANAPAVYKVEVGLIDNASQERLPAYAPDGSPLGTNFAGARRSDLMLRD